MQTIGQHRTEYRIGVYLFSNKVILIALGLILIGYLLALLTAGSTKSYDLDGRGLHFVCELEPVNEHPEYDLAVEVIIDSKPHKHNKMVQRYRILQGAMSLHVDDDMVTLNEGEHFVVTPGKVHWATSSDEAMVELYSVPGWTKEDHIMTEDYVSSR